jgi:hypothetical protein
MKFAFKLLRVPAKSMNHVHFAHCLTFAIQPLKGPSGHGYTNRPQSEFGTLYFRNAARLVTRADNAVYRFITL